MIIFRRLKISHESHEFILDPGTVVNTYVYVLCWLSWILCVLNPGKGVCADPVEKGAILEVKGPGPPSGDSEGQLSPDRGGGKT